MDQQPSNPAVPQADGAQSSFPYQAQYASDIAQSYQQGYAQPGAYAGAQAQMQQQPMSQQQGGQQYYQQPQQTYYQQQPSQASQFHQPYAPQGQAYQQAQQFYSVPAQAQPVHASQYPAAAMQDPMQPQSKRSGLAIAGMVLGIIALALSAVPIINNFAFILGIIGLVLSVIALIMIIKKLSLTGKGMAIAGIVLSAVSLVIVLVSQAAYSAALDEVQESFNESFSGSEPVSAYTPQTTESTTADDGALVDAQDMSIGASATFTDGLVVTVVSVTPGLANYDGSPVSCVTVSYKNEGSKNASFNPFDWKAQDPQGAQRSECYYSDDESPLHSGELAPGGTVTGNLYFDDPVAKVVYSPSFWSSENDVSWLVS